MPSCDADTAFVPLGGPAPEDPFRPFGTPATTGDVSAAPAPDPFVQALEAGRAQGRAEAAHERAALAREVATAVAAVGAWRAELRTRYGRALVELALAVARKIVGDELAARPERWHAIIAAAVRELVDRDEVTIRVGPGIAALLRESEPAPAGTAEVRIVEDDTLGDGACRIESRGGDVDCGIDAQLATIADALGVGKA